MNWMSASYKDLSNMHFWSYTLHCCGQKICCCFPGTSHHVSLTTIIITWYQNCVLLWKIEISSWSLHKVVSSWQSSIYLKLPLYRKWWFVSAWTVMKGRVIYITPSRGSLPYFSPSISTGYSHHVYCHPPGTPEDKQIYLSWYNALF